MSSPALSLRRATTLVAPLLIAAASLMAPPTSAQGLPVQVRLSTGTFLYDAEQSLVEVYLSVGASTLTYTRTEAGFEAALTADIALRPASQSAPTGAATGAVATERLERRYVVADTAALQPGQVFVEQVRLVAPPGEYEAAAHIEGAGASAFGRIEIVADVVVPAYGDGAATRLSSLQLATSVARATDPEDRFVKSGLRLVPNPDLFYGADRPVVPVYAEVYNPPGDSTYTLLTFLTDGSGMAPLPGTELRQSRPVRTVDPVIQQLNIAALPSGVYYVRMAVLTAANEAATETSARFYVINPDVARPELAMAEMTAEETLYAAMATEELEREVDLARVVATGSERSQIGRLATDEDRRAFLVRFWAGRDTDPRPNVNGARDRFFELLRTVESRFGRGSRDGYDSDRGRVYLTYGPPSAVDRRDNEPNKLPHEIWAYERIPGQGRATFVFVDRFTTGELELVHSTVTGEISVPNWEQTIIVTQ